MKLINRKREFSTYEGGSDEAFGSSLAPLSRFALRCVRCHAAFCFPMRAQRPACARLCASLALLLLPLPGVGEPRGSGTGVGRGEFSTPRMNVRRKIYSVEASARHLWSSWDFPFWKNTFLSLLPTHSLHLTHPALLVGKSILETFCFFFFLPKLVVKWTQSSTTSRRN